MPTPVELFSQVSGDGERTVVLVHGLFGMSDNLGQLAKALEDSYRVHRLDLRNHGRSARSDSMALTEMAADIENYLDINQIDNAAIVGHSLGGKVAMQLALQGCSRLIGFAVADIAPVQYPPHHEGILAGLNSLQFDSIGNRADADRQLAEYVDEVGVRQFLLKNLYRNEHKQFALRMNLQTIVACYPQIMQAPEGQPCQLPTLFIKGQNSDYITAEHTDLIKQLFPNLHFKMINGTGHWLHAEKPEIFNRIVQQFLDAHIGW
ncbi:alpha/beta fold hydrolase [Porticoccus sp. W117]|uniref:alpha/beta fold hydrolase n=1 Tax=Porticoccus sp. W117 TaxID=3054777 RepID=UPI0025922C37|nr:alpha/beta fold hydrolase [Porticoccus sp. W117]MDM3872523.1 alpha/beta fold hydrolase [Porticoccus sp. W117]